MKNTIFQGQLCTGMYMYKRPYIHYYRQEVLSLYSVVLLRDAVALQIMECLCDTIYKSLFFLQGHRTLDLKLKKIWKKDSSTKAEKYLILFWLNQPLFQLFVVGVISLQSIGTGSRLSDMCQEKGQLTL